MSTTPLTVEAAEPRKSFGARLAGVFFSPGPTFADIAREPDWIAPLSLMTILSVAGMEIFLNRIGMRPVVEWAVEHSARQSSVTAEQMEGLIRFYTIAMHVVGVVAVPVQMLIVAAIGLLIVNAILGAKISFKTAFAVPCYANLVTIVGMVAGVVMIFAGGLEHFISNPGNPTPFSLGFFLNPQETSKVVLSLGASLDILTLWFLGLLGVGYSEATGRKVKAVSVFLIFLGIWMIWALIKMGGSMLGS